MMWPKLDLPGTNIPIAGDEEFDLAAELGLELETFNNIFSPESV
jgi:hypothetical protein